MHLCARWNRYRHASESLPLRTGKYLPTRAAESLHRYSYARRNHLYVRRNTWSTIATTSTTTRGKIVIDTRGGIATATSSDITKSITMLVAESLQLRAAGSLPLYTCGGIKYHTLCREGTVAGVPVTLESSGDRPHAPAQPLATLRGPDANTEIKDGRAER